MRLLLAAFAFLPLLPAQDLQVLKSAEPRYEQYSPELAANFDTANASVTVTVLANGKPLAIERSNADLPIAVVMALKDYEFQPLAEIPHGRPEAEWNTYQVTLNVPIRRSKTPVDPSTIYVGTGVAKGLLVKQVRPEYSEFARHNRLQGVIRLQAAITAEGEVASLTATNGLFALIESAYDAVRQWQFRPYLLNGQPVEWRTEIQVNFNLN